MSESQIITLVIAILGVLHGPLVAKAIAAIRKPTPPK